MSDQRPKFLKSFLDEIGKEAEERNWLAVIPFLLLAICAGAAVVAYYVPERFWENTRWEPAIALYAGLLTFNGLVLTLGWNAFARIYDVLLRADFGKYLMKNGLLASYLLHITFMHIFQILAALASAAGLVTIIIDGTPLWVSRTVFGGSLALTVYAIKHAFGAVAVMNDLVWQSNYFESHKPSAQSNVVPLGERA